MIQIIKNFKNYNINPLLWIFFPLFIPLIFIFVKKINMEFFRIFFTGENGIIENGTFLILLFAIILAISSLKIIKNNFKEKKLFIFIIIFTLSIIYFAGEEVNWGQHWFHWNAPFFFEIYNDQYIGDTSETNFHNITSWLDQKPRILLTFFVLFGGIICPFYFNKNNNKTSLKFWIFPKIYCFPTSIVFLFFYILDNSYKILCYGKPGIDITCKYIPQLLVFRTSEIIELYFAIFLLIYIFSINLELKKV